MKYFHLIGMKESSSWRYQLDFLVWWETYNEIKSALEKLGIVILSLDEYKKPTSDFWKYEMIIPFFDKDFPIITYSDTLEKSLREAFDMWLEPKNVIVSDWSLTQAEIDNLMHQIKSEVEERHLEELKAKEEQTKKEIKKFENKDLKDWLKVINNNIDRINQIMFIWTNILTPIEKNKLKDIQDELKKIRLWSNFPKMVELLLATQKLIDQAESKILKILDDKKFFIDRNSTVTNIDIINQYNLLTKTQEKMLVKTALSNKEQFYFIWKFATVFSIFFRKDLIDTLKKTKKTAIQSTMSMLEILSLWMLISITLFWFFLYLQQQENTILIYLSILWRFGLLIFIFNSLHLQKLIYQIIGTLLIIWLTVFGFFIIKSTFAF